MDLITCFALCIPRAVGCIRGGTSKVKGLKQSPEEELSTNSLSFTSFPVLFRIIGFYIIVNHLEAHLSRTHLHNVTFKLVYLKQHSKFASLLESFHFFFLFFFPHHTVAGNVCSVQFVREKSRRFIKLRGREFHKMSAPYLQQSHWPLLVVVRPSINRTDLIRPVKISDSFS